MVQRGNDRLPCFLGDAGRLLCLQALRDMSMRYACAAERQSAYRALFDQVLGNDDINDIRACIQQQRALGDERFRAMVERKPGRCASVRLAHRPPAPANPTDKAL